MKPLFFLALACLLADESTVAVAADAARHDAPCQPVHAADAQADVKASAECIASRGASHRLWIVGETHGTRETPMLVEALAACAKRAGREIASPAEARKMFGVGH